MNKQILLTELTRDRVAALAPIMKAAFDADALHHIGEPGGPEGYENGTFLNKWAFAPGATSLVIEVDGRARGAAILWINAESGEGILGCMFVDAEIHGSGVGSRAWQLIEARFPSVRIWHTQTPTYSTRNHAFYVNKCGFSVVEIDRTAMPQGGQYKLRKFTN